VLSAFLKFFDQEVWNFGYAGWYATSWAESNRGEITGLIMFVFLVSYALWDSMRAKEE
jgi:hypothetical protein